MLSIQEICQATGKSEKTIYRMMNDGKLPYKTISNKRYVAISDIDSHFKIQTRTNTEADLSKKIDMLTSEIARLSTLVESLVTNPPSPLRINSQQELTDKDCHRSINDSQSQSFNLDKIKSEITKKTPSSSNEIRAKKSKMQLCLWPQREKTEVFFFAFDAKGTSKERLLVKLRAIQSFHVLWQKQKQKSK